VARIQGTHDSIPSVAMYAPHTAIVQGQRFLIMTRWL